MALADRGVSEVADSLVAVVGLGKIGLPLAVQIASSGRQVIGCDIDRRVVTQIRKGTSPIKEEPGLAELLPALVSSGKIAATDDTSRAVTEAGTVLVVVPLVVDGNGEPQFNSIDAATRSIAAGLRPGHLIIYETTVPVGSTRSRFGTMLEDVSGLRLGRDFMLAFSPERVYSGRVFADLRKYPKLVGGIDERSTEAAVAFYEKVLDFDDRPDLSRANGVWALESAEAAEFVKLAETTYRDVNIGLANEFAEFAEMLGVDVASVISAANSQPYSQIHRPGLVGGHCIPVYPYFYLSGHPGARLPTVAREVNTSVAKRVIHEIAKETGPLEGKRAVVMGVTYRGGVRETAFSGAFALIEQLEAGGASVVVHDPLIDEADLLRLGLTPYRLGQPCDVAIVQADHREYVELGTSDLPGCEVIADLRGVVDDDRFSDNVSIYRLGRGWNRADMTSGRKMLGEP